MSSIYPVYRKERRREKRERERREYFWKDTQFSNGGCLSGVDGNLE